MAFETSNKTRLSKDSAPHLALLVFTIIIGRRSLQKFQLKPEAVLFFFYGGDKRYIK